MVAIRPSDKSEHIRIVIKGAPEFIVPMCTSQLAENGSEAPIDTNERKRILDQEIIQNYCKSGLRSIVYAYKDIDVFDWEFIKKNNNHFERSKDREVLERDFCFVAAFGLHDELREGV